jgi:flavin reductase (DIM6/NTAB) family NADH-FMN oxidoreductase RutF
MAKTEKEPFAGILALPAFPLILVTAGQNVMTAAAFSFYSFEPPCVMVGLRPTTLTFELVSQIGEFGINILRADQVEIARFCGSVSGRDSDKFASPDLTPQPATAIDSWLVAECPVSLECRVVHQVQFGGSHAWFVGQIQAAHVDEGYGRDQALMFWPGEYRRLGEVIVEVKKG